MFIRVLVCMLAVNLLGLVPEGVRAADENMDSAVYLTFDPVSGQFTQATKDLSAPADTGDAAAQQNHAAMSQQVSQASSMSIDDAAILAGTATDESGEQSSMIVLAAMLALAVFGLIGYLMRKGQPKQAA